MTFSRRELLAVAAAAFALGPAVRAHALTPEVAEQIDAFASAEPVEGGLRLAAPEIAENGNAVQIEVSTDEGPDAVDAIAVFSDGNPNPEVATFFFTALSGSVLAATRIRLATTQNVVAVARMRDGSARIAMREVKVTIGGCGG